ncbi:MAG: hypothetical protein JNK21_08690 [Rhodospirillaceae bacterium]|nr:hypothetical protein [Rhodospirillaceae bacterium]
MSAERQSRLKARVAAGNDAAGDKGFVAHIVTSGRIDVIDDWLSKNAKGRWTIRVEGQGDAEGDVDGPRKYAIRFSTEDDRTNFRERFTKRKTL